MDDYLATQSLNSATALVEDLLWARNPAGIELFDYMTDRGYGGYMVDASDQILTAYGAALAAAGKAADADAMSLDPRAKYEGYSQVQLSLARNYTNTGATDHAITLLDRLREIDPLLNFPATDPDSHLGYMGASPLPLIYEQIAEAYAACRAYGKAVDTYASSRRYPDQSEITMARTAVANGDVIEYLDALLAFDADEHRTMFTVSRMTVALLKEIGTTLRPGVSLCAASPDVEPRVTTLNERLSAITRGRRPGDTLTQRVIEETQIALANGVGDFDTALMALRVSGQVATPFPTQRCSGSVRSSPRWQSAVTTSPPSRRTTTFAASSRGLRGSITRRSTQS